MPPLGEEAEALARLGRALVELGASVQHLAAVRGLPSEQSAEGSEAADVERLWDRLGLDNQKFLYELANDFPPGGQPFELDDVAQALGMTRMSARARIMNIGRSLKAMGAGAPGLWATRANPKTRRRAYTWNAEAHRAILRIVEG